MNTMKRFLLYLVFLLLFTSVSCSRNSSHPQDTSYLRRDTQDTYCAKNLTDTLEDELLDLNTPIGDPPTTSLIFLNGERIRDFSDKCLNNDTIGELKQILKRKNYIFDDIKILKDDKSLEKYRQGGFVKSGEEKWLEIVYEIKAHPINQKGEIYEVEAHMPYFPGGEKALMAFIDQNIRCPKKMIQDSVHGRVIVYCIIEKDGSIEEYGIANNLLKDKSGNPCTDSTVKKLCEKEALRIIKMMPKWTPGKNINGEPVRVRYNIPVNFNEKSNKINKFLRYED